MKPEKHAIRNLARNLREYRLLRGYSQEELAYQTDTDRTYSLSSYKSFSLESLEMEDEPSQISVNPILLQRVSRSIEQKLITRGFTKSSNPDMIVRFSVATEREVDAMMIIQRARRLIKKYSR